MSRRLLILIVTALIVACWAVPASAQNESWSMGGGYFTLPQIDDNSGKLDTSGFYTSLQMRSTSYVIEADYALGGSKFFAIAADYLYPLSQGEGVKGSFVGTGYTYFSSDTFDNAQGFNAIAGMEFSQGLVGTLRYDFLSSDHQMFTAGVFYTFH
jgi:hypothetical protein